jgi:hypothetical protein
LHLHYRLLHLFFDTLVVNSHGAKLDPNNFSNMSAGRVDIGEHDLHWNYPLHCQNSIPSYTRQLAGQVSSILYPSVAGQAF